MKLFLVLFSFVYLLINTYIFIRGWQAVALLPLICKILFVLLFVIASSSFIVAMLCRETLPLIPLKVIYAIGTGWFFCMSYYLLFFILTDVVALLDHWLHFLPGNIASHFRQIQFVMVTLTVLVMMLWGYRQFSQPVVNTHHITINKKAGDRKNLRIVGISDVHLGLLVDKKRLAGYVEQVNALNPDLILIAGDIVDNSTRPLNEEKMYEELNRLQAPLGIYTCLGNHEHISGIENSLSFFSKTKINPLVDTAVHIEGDFWIVGRDDRSNPKRKTLEELLVPVDKNQPVFLIDHQPYDLDETMKNGVDLQFSGHTHNGQIWPGNLIVRKMYEVGQGYKQKKNLHVYVSAGIAIWGPLFRIGTVSEIVVFDIAFK